MNFRTSTDDDFNTVPAETILIKLEETPAEWLYGKSHEDFIDPNEKIFEASKRELANWGPEVPFMEDGETLDMRANSKQKLNIMYHGNRAGAEPNHSEMFLADTEFEDAEIAMWDMPKHTSMRARQRVRAMPEQGENNAERVLTETGLVNAKRYANTRFVTNFKNFKTQDLGAPTNNNVVMKQIRHDLSHQDESLKTYQPIKGQVRNYRATPVKVANILNMTDADKMATIGSGASAVRGQQRKLGDFSKNAQAGQQEQRTSVNFEMTPAKSGTRQDVMKAYRNVTGMQTTFGVREAGLQGKSASRDGDTIRAQFQGVASAEHARMTTTGSNRMGAAPQYSSGMNNNVDYSTNNVGLRFEGLNAKSAEHFDPVSRTHMHHQTHAQTFISSARIIAKGLRGGYDARKLSGKVQHAGTRATFMSDRMHVAKSVVPLIKNHGKAMRHVDHSGLRYGRTAFRDGGVNRLKLAPKPLEHTSRLTSEEHRDHVELFNAQTKAAKFYDPVSATTTSVDSVPINTVEGEQQLLSMQKRMGNKRLRMRDTQIAYDDRELVPEF